MQKNNPEWIEFKLEDPFITLTNLLKVTNVVSSGGHAKVLIQSGNVKLNSTICTQRGKKIVVHDVVECTIDGVHSTIKITS